MKAENVKTNKALTEIVCVFGIRGSGKTTWLKHAIKEESNVFVYDVLGQFDTGVVITDYGALREYVTKQNLNRFKIIFRPIKDVELFDLCCVLVKSLGLGYGKIIFVVDEIDRYCNAVWEPGGLKDLISYGRHYHVSLLCASRTPAEVSKLLTSQASKFVCFTMHEKRHIDYLASHIGEQARELPNTPFYHPIIHTFSQ